MTVVMTDDQLDTQVVKNITLPMYNKGGSKDFQGPNSYGVGEPNLSDIELLILFIINAGGDWVLIDRNRAARKINDSSSRHIALRRRGFEVTSRHVQGVRNYWARWTHPPEASLPPKIPSASTDSRGTTFGSRPG